MDGFEKESVPRSDTESARKTLRDDDPSLFDRLPVLVSSPEPAEAGITLQHRGIDGADVDRSVPVKDLNVPVGMDPTKARDFSNLVVEFLWNLRLINLSDVEISLELRIHPPDERLPEASDHGSKTDGHGQGDHESSHRHGGPAEVLSDVSCRHPSR